MSVSAAANTRWQKSYQNWSDVQLPVPEPAGPIVSFNTNHLRDFYNHRQLAMAEYDNAWHDAVKAVSPKIKTGKKIGNCCDTISLSRGTISVVPLLKIDMIMQHNGADGWVRFTHAVARAAGAANRGTGDELFYVEAGRAVQGDQINQVKDVYRAGGSLMDWAGFYVAGGGEFDNAKIAQARAWIKTVMDAVHAEFPIGGIVSHPTPAGTLTVSNLRLLSNTWENGFDGGGSYRERWLALTENYTKDIRVTINNDLTPA